MESTHRESSNTGRTGEDLLRRLAAAERVGELIAHELRNVVIVLRSHSDLLAQQWDRLDDDDRRHSIETMDQGTEYLSHLVSSLLGIASDRPRNHRVLDVRRHLEERIGLELWAASVPDLDVHLDVARDLRAAVDVDLLDLAVRNLLRNAMAHGRPPVTIAATVTPALLRVRVEDEGNGVDQGFAPRLFDRFQRGEPSGPSGLGLGLSILREVLERDGGTITYDAGRRGGAAFVVELPIVGTRAHSTRHPFRDLDLRGDGRDGRDGRDGASSLTRRDGVAQE